VGAEVRLHGADTLTAVGHEDDLLVGLQPLGPQQLEQAPARLAVVARDKAEAAGCRPLVVRPIRVKVRTLFPTITSKHPSRRRPRT
jgi:hypothetical protein